MYLNAKSVANKNKNVHTNNALKNPKNAKK